MKMDFLPQLKEAAAKAEALFEDMCEFEFTVERGELYVLNVRVGNRTGRAAINIAIDLFVERKITAKTVLARITPADLDQVFEPNLMLVPDNILIARGIAASTGIAVGVLRLIPESGPFPSLSNAPFIAVLREVSPEHIRVLDEAHGVLTTTGGPTSHAAMVCRGWRKPCVVGSDGRIDFGRKTLNTKVGSVEEGEYITIDGFTGNVYKGKAQTKPRAILRDPRLIVLIRIIDALSAEQELPLGKVGATWHIRDMLTHNLPLQEDRDSLNMLSTWPRSGALKHVPVSFNNLKRRDAFLILGRLKDWLIPSETVQDIRYIWRGLRLCLSRLLARYVGIGRHYQFYRPLFDPLQLIFQPDALDLSPRDECRIQIVGDEFFGINYSVPEFLEIDTIRIYLAALCSTPNDLWRTDRTNPNGEKLLSGSQEIVALKIVVNDAPVSLSDLPHFYNYLRRKEYFWGWYRHHGIARQEVVQFLADLSGSKHQDKRVRDICRQIDLVGEDGQLTKVGRSLVVQSSVSTRRQEYVHMLGE